MNTVKIDAKGKKLGRISTEIAIILMGKNEPTYERHLVKSPMIEVSNVSDLDISNAKMNNKKYKRYSGYPGGLKERTMKQVIEKKGYGEVLKTAVFGMLPKNKLRSKMIKRLIIK